MVGICITCDVSAPSAVPRCAAGAAMPMQCSMRQSMRGVGAARRPFFFCALTDAERQGGRADRRQCYKMINIKIV